MSTFASMDLDTLSACESRQLCPACCMQLVIKNHSYADLQIDVQILLQLTITEIYECPCGAAWADVVDWLPSRSSIKPKGAKS